MRPTPQEESYARERHAPALAMQTQHEHAAMENRQNFAAVNHGRPSVAATGRPGDFSARSAVGARAAGGEYRAPEMSPREARVNTASFNRGNSMPENRSNSVPANRGNSNEGFRPFTPPSRGGNANPNPNANRGGNWNQNPNANRGNSNPNPNPNANRGNANGGFRPFTPPSNGGNANPNANRGNWNQRGNVNRGGENRYNESRPQNQPQMRPNQGAPREASRPGPPPQQPHHQGPPPKEERHR